MYAIVIWLKCFHLVAVLGGKCEWYWIIAKFPGFLPQRMLFNAGGLSQKRVINDPASAWSNVNILKISYRVK